MTAEEFHLQLENLFHAGEWEFWGAFDNGTGRLEGYSMNWIYDRSCEYKTIKTDPENMKRSISYLLIWEMNRHYLNERDFRYVNDGSRSLMHESNFQEFLRQKFLFRKAYCRMHICYAPLFSAAVKTLYPLRGLIFSGRAGILQKAGTLLKHEEIIRNYNKKMG